MDSRISISDLPYDILAAILSHLSAQDIIEFGCTSKTLHEVSQDCSIWRLVLHDLLEIIPSRTLMAAAPLMSTAEIKGEVLRMVQMDKIFDRKSVQPLKTTRIPCSPLAAHLDVVPGSQHIVIMLENRVVNLYHVSDFTQPVLTFLRPACSSADIWLPMPKYVLVSSTSRGELLVLLSEVFYDKARSSFAHTTIYHLDCLNQTTRLLSTIIKPDAFADFAFREGWVAVGWKVEHDYFLLVRQISLVHREGEDEVLMNLKGPEVTNRNIITTFLCPHMILVTLSGKKSYVYEIPQTSYVLTGDKPTTVDVYPLSSHDDATKADPGHELWNCLCKHLDGSRISTAGDADDGHWFEMVVLPMTQQAERNFVRHPIGVCDYGPSRAIWAVDRWRHPESDSILLQGCTHFTRFDEHVGYTRLGRSRAPDPSHLVLIPLLEQTDVVKDISMDETRGKIFVLVKGLQPGFVEVVVVELI